MGRCITTPPASSGGLPNPRSSTALLRRILDRVILPGGGGVSRTVSIPFTGRSTSGASFSGTVRIRVDGAAQTISYRVSQGGSVTFSASDFNAAARDAVGETLNRVRFTLPSSSRGTLYYDYEDGDYASKVSASRSYYRSASPYLDRVSFVPASSFSGTVSIPFTGWTAGDERFTGTVEIQVTDGAGASQIIYTTAYRPVTFSVSDFRFRLFGPGAGDIGLRTVYHCAAFRCGTTLRPVQRHACDCP